MANPKEKLNLSSPTAVAIDIVAVGLIAWKLKNMYDRRNDKDDAAEPLGYPMNEVNKEAVTYINTSGSGPITVGTIGDKEGYITVRGEGRIGKDGHPEVILDEGTSESDPERLAILRDRILSIKDAWQEKVSQSLPGYLQKD